MNFVISGVSWRCLAKRSGSRSLGSFGFGSAKVPWSTPSPWQVMQFIRAKRFASKAWNSAFIFGSTVLTM